MNRAKRIRWTGALVCVTLIATGCTVTKPEVAEPLTSTETTEPASPSVDDGLPAGVEILTDLPEGIDITRGTIKPLDPPGPDDDSCGSYTLDPVEFEVDAWELDDDGRAVLDDLAQWLSEQTVDWTAEVRGHTDVRSSSLQGGNEELSRMRAGAVVEHLVAAGIERSRLEAVGFGASVLVDAGTNDAAHARNRRVEFVMTCEGR